MVHTAWIAIWKKKCVLTLSATTYKNLDGLQVYIGRLSKEGKYKYVSKMFF